MMSRLRLNKPLIALETVEEALAAESDAATDQVVQAARSRWFVGTGESVAAEVREFASRWGVDEVMLSPVAGAYESEPADSAAGRAQTLELVAAAL
jgi:alkanesulfonate monooxygenase SsuD/methylene tetrahydromethanopterin reductase-like flavin-dependent oxidoreductase (luciferase family)